MGRPFSRLVALVALVAASPVLLVAAVAIKVSSRGPVLYRAPRVGKDGHIFTMLKLRTMRPSESVPGNRITGSHDPRIFTVGRWLRQTKLDELPQLVNVVRGHMALVGPRPEDPTIVADHYTALMRETLAVAPGLSSPGSLAYYAEEHALPSDPATAERIYLTDLLPRKIARDLVYVRQRSWHYDAQVVVRTLAAIVGCHGIFSRRLTWEAEQAEPIVPEILRGTSPARKARR